MKTVVAIVMSALLSSAAMAQTISTGQSDSLSGGGGNHSESGALRVTGRNATLLSSMIAYGSFRVGDEDRFGPMIVLQYTPRRFSGPAFDFYAGVLLRINASGPVDENDFVPVASTLAPYYSPYSNYRNDNLFRMTQFSVGLAFLGADVTFYLADGPVKPYVGLGSSFALWSYSSQLNGTLAPGVKAGLNVMVSSSFSGFAEVRRLVGVPNFIGPEAPRFNGLTSAALGISFAPSLR